LKERKKNEKEGSEGKVTAQGLGLEGEINAKAN
jgi:hypothetical protein